ncbi:MAG: hypothetical protein AB7D57_13830, partial [Desulfovibrionaceae bacterium]
MPNPFRSPKALRIRTKLLLVNVLAGLVGGAIVLTVWLSYRHVENLLSRAAARGMERVVQGAHTGVELARVFADTNRLLATYFVYPGRFETTARDLTRRARILGEENTDADLRGLLQRFNEQLASLLVQCRAVNAQLQEMDRAWRTLS